MGKSKTTAKQQPFPAAPWIYVNDPTDSAYASKLAALIPCSAQIALTKSSTNSTGELVSALRSEKYRHIVAVIADKRKDHEGSVKHKTTRALQEGALKHGRNFVSVNIIADPTCTEDGVFGTNHLNVYAYEEDIAEKIYKWLFSVLTIQETLHLIPEEQMRETDTEQFSDYSYCPVSDNHLRPKNAKLQFVVLILTKPQIGPNRCLSWTVVDRSGIGKFWFQYRGPHSQYTWDWVLALKPGDRKALPRMPMVQIKEKKLITFVKSPFRITGAVINGSGTVVKGIGNGMCTVGRAVRMGKPSEWVAEPDVDANGKKIKYAGCEDEGNLEFVPPLKKTQIRIFAKDGEKVWSDKDSNASTQAGSLLNEKHGKEFL